MHLGNFIYTLLILKLFWVVVVILTDDRGQIIGLDEFIDLLDGGQFLELQFLQSPLLGLVRFASGDVLVDLTEITTCLHLAVPLKTFTKKKTNNFNYLWLCNSSPYQTTSQWPRQSSSWRNTRTHAPTTKPLSLATSTSRSKQSGNNSTSKLSSSPSKWLKTRSTMSNV